ncbi:MAG: PAS domain S-box protein [SAR86 cluster bacterium]|uniref:histidine kinase n=1 Tax=SAR86 cluster bacterium TaxID=2030880 RepID=A0A972W0T0_9GAMM|nr:PAS domain S-box protein [SAR86 cluster bacterium]
MTASDYVEIIQIRHVALTGNLMEENARYHPLIVEKPDVSCHYLDCLMALCRQHFKNASALAVCEAAYIYLSDPSKLFDWDKFLLIDKALTSNLDNDEIAAAGMRSWNSHQFRTCQLISQSLTGTQEAYRFAFGAAGTIEKMLPCRLELQQISPRYLRVNLQMQHGYQPSTALYHLLRGQMACLLTSHTKNLKQVTWHQTANLVTFDIHVPLINLAWHLVRKFAPSANSRREQMVMLMTQFDQTFAQREANTRLMRQSANAKKKLADMQYRYDTVTNHLTESLWVVNSNRQTTFVTPSIQQWLGYSRQQFLALPIERLFSPAAAQHLQLSLNKLSTQSHASSTMTTELRHCDGYWLPAEIECQSQPKINRSSQGIVIIARSLSAVHNLKSEIREVAANYATLFQQSPEAILLIDHRNEITASNQSATDIFGFSQQELKGKSLADLLPDLTSRGDTSRTLDEQLDDTAGIGMQPNGLKKTRRTIHGRHKKGSSIPVEVSVNRQHRQHLEGHDQYTVIIRDNSKHIQRRNEQQALQYQLLAAQKMETVGQLAGGIAHDFNNLLVAINGYAELCQAPTLGTAERHDYLSQIQHAGRLAADMTHKLLAFSRPQKTEYSVIDINNLIVNLDLLIRRLLPANIDVHISKTTDMALVLADPSQIEQVIINLMINARDAMFEPGCLSITTDRQLITEADTDHEIQPGNYIVISIVDSGTGISEKDLEHIFKPFFTTKPEGMGTGLGLSLVADIIKQHRGFIKILSTQGGGSTFRVHLPACHARPLQKTNKDRRKIVGGTETLLLVEDNDHVRDLARLILRGVGYNVIEARDGDEALTIFKAQHKGIDLVVMDVVLPKMGGRQASERMRAISPNVRLIYTSGYPYNGTHTRFIIEQGHDFIQKPYSTDLLCERIRHHLD